MEAELSGIWTKMWSFCQDNWEPIVGVGQFVVALIMAFMSTEQVRHHSRRLLPFAAFLAAMMIVIGAVGTNWLSFQVALPLWGAVLGLVVTLGIGAAGHRAYGWLRHDRTRANKLLPSNPFPMDGVLWDYTERGFVLNPLCPECQMHMRHVVHYGYDFADMVGEHSWICRVCRRPYTWKGTLDDLKEELLARWDADRRHLAVEKASKSTNGLRL